MFPPSHDESRLMDEMLLPSLLQSNQGQQGIVLLAPDIWCGTTRSMMAFQMSLNYRPHSPQNCGADVWMRRFADLLSSTGDIVGCKIIDSTAEQLAIDPRSLKPL